MCDLQHSNSSTSNSSSGVSCTQYILQILCKRARLVARSSALYTVYCVYTEYLECIDALAIVRATTDQCSATHTHTHTFIHKYDHDRVQLDWLLFVYKHCCFVVYARYCLLCCASMCLLGRLTLYIGIVCRYTRSIKHARALRDPFHCKQYA